MKQLYVFCEGQTEQRFCTQLLQPHLFPDSTGVIHTLAVGEKDYRHVYGLGGRKKYERVRQFICKSIKQREGVGVYFTTLFDLYALPNDFPGSVENVRNPADPTPYVRALETAFAASIDYHRFVPYLQLHEYETLLFADPDAFAYSFENCESAIEKLKEIAVSFQSIERIDDGRKSAPSKRIIELIPQYEGRKSTAGPDIAEYIGLEKIRAACPHFHEWLKQLERLAWQAR